MARNHQPAGGAFSDRFPGPSNSGLAPLVFPLRGAKSHWSPTLRDTVANPVREVQMPDHQEILRQSLLTDLTTLRDNLDKAWTIVLSLPIGKVRTNLELSTESRY